MKSDYQHVLQHYTQKGLVKLDQRQVYSVGVICALKYEIQNTILKIYPKNLSFLLWCCVLTSERVPRTLPLVEIIFFGPHGKH